MIKDIFLSEITYIIIDITIGSLSAFFGVLAYGKTKKLTGLFFVLSSIFLYFVMVFRIFEILNIFILKNFLFHGIPLYYDVINNFPPIFMLIGFIFMLKEK